MKYLVTISCILLVMLPFTQGQPTNSPAEEVQKYFSEAVKGNNYTISTATIRLVPVSEMVAITTPYFSNVDRLVRYKAIDLIRRKGQLENTKAENQLLTSCLLEACKDKESGNSGVASRALSTFSSGDFSSYAADSILALISSHAYHLERIILLSGFIHNSSTISFLENLKISGDSLTAKQRWTVDLALARLGNRESIEYCLDKVRSTGVDDRTVTHLFPDLAYIRNKEAFDYMLNEILSDEEKCLSANPDNEKPVICAFRIMELVAPYMRDFPVKLTSYGELAIDNYDEALIKVKEWISRNKNYSLEITIY